MRKRHLIIVSACILVLILLGGMTAYIMITGSQMYTRNVNQFTNERTSDQVMIDWLTNDKGFDVTAYQAAYRTEEIEITSSVDGHSIPATYIYAPGNTDRKGDTVIMVHGKLGNRISNYPMSQLFLNNGYNVITYDQRNSGGNYAQHATYGYLESYDAMDYVRYARSIMNADSTLGLWGQSMGAATIENAMDAEGFDENVDFVVLDSPLGNMEDVIGSRDLIGTLQKAYASALSKRNLGFAYSQQRVYPQIEATKVPVLVVATEVDEQIPYELQYSIYETIQSDQKMLYTVDDSKHADVYFDHPQEYQQKLETFLKKAGLLS